MIENINSTRVVKTKFKDLEEIRSNLTPKLMKLFSKELPDILDVLPSGAVTTVFNDKADDEHLEKWPELSTYLEFLDSYIKEYVKLNNIFTEKYNIIDMWTNRYSPGTFIKHHRHIVYENAVVISFYFKCPKNSGSLFVNFPEESSEEYEVNTEEGDVVIFPSSALHWTSPNQSDEDRIVIITELSFGDEIILTSPYGTN